MNNTPHFRERFFLASILLTIALNSQAQKNDTLPSYRNTIKLNLISSFLYSNSGAISFERIVKPYQSWGVMLGYVEFPLLGSLGPSISVSRNTRHSGFVVGGEYRFYLKKENKYATPHGLYWGPFTNYFLFSNERQLSQTATDGTVTSSTLNTDISALNIGIQLGYQYVWKERWTLDMVVFGPSISRYGLKSSLTGDLSQQGILGSELAAALANRFPLLKDLLADQPVDVKGSTSSWSTGFRYQLNIGYRFGGKRKI